MSESDDGLFNSNRLGNLTPDTRKLDQSDFKYIIGAASGEFQKTSQARPKSYTALIVARERGLPGSLSLSRRDKCRISNDFIPSKSKVVASHTNKIFCSAYSQNGDAFLIASQDKKIRVYDSSTTNLRLVNIIAANEVGWSILDATFSPDGSKVAYCSWCDKLNICDVNGDGSDPELLNLNPIDQRLGVFSLKFSGDGRELLCGANDCCLYICDRNRPEQFLKVCVHDDDVNSVTYADEASQIIYTASDDGLVKVWDKRTLNERCPVPVGKLAGHYDGITHVESRGDCRHLLTNSKDQSIKLWDLRKFSSEENVFNTRKIVKNNSCWDYRWQRIPLNISLPIYNCEDSSLMTYKGHRVFRTLVRCHFSPAITTAQKYIYVGCASGRTLIYDTLTGLEVAGLGRHRNCVRDAAWHPYRQEIITTSWDGDVAQWLVQAKK